MPKYPLPIELPVGEKPIITQRYGDTSNLAWYKEHGINFPFHNGIDVISSGGQIKTYGAKLVCPVPEAYQSKIWSDSPMSTKGNGIEITWKEGGNVYRLLVWHCSEVMSKYKFVLQEVLGLIGNSGLVKPEPSSQCPYCGSHTHIMAYKNGVLIDPEEILDRNKWFTGEPTPPAKDLPPLTFFVSLLQTIVKLQKTLSTFSKQK